MKMRRYRCKPRCLPCLVMLLLLSSASSVPVEPPRSLNAHSPLPLWAALPLLFGVSVILYMMVKRTSAQPSKNQKKQRAATSPAAGQPASHVDSSWAPFESSLLPPDNSRFDAFLANDPPGSPPGAGVAAAPIDGHSDTHFLLAQQMLAAAGLSHPERDPFASIIHAGEHVVYTTTPPATAPEHPPLLLLLLVYTITCHHSTCC